MSQSVFVTGGTGYMKSTLISLLIKRGHHVKALVRPGSEKKLPAGAACVTGKPLQKDSNAEEVRGSENPIDGIRILDVTEMRKLAAVAR